MFRLHQFKRVGSTNSKAKDYRHGDVLVAEVQTKGRGRLKRKWSSGKGGIWMSVVLEPKVNTPQRFTDIACRTVKDVLKELYCVETKVKKPNDLLYKGKKICGILTENVYKGKLEKTVIGIGINVNNMISDEFKDFGVSLCEIIGRKASKERIINGILKKIKVLL